MVAPDKTFSSDGFATIEASQQSPEFRQKVRQSQGPKVVLSKMNPTSRNLESINSFKKSEIAVDP